MERLSRPQLVVLTTGVVQLTTRSARVPGLPRTGSRVVPTGLVGLACVQPTTRSTRCGSRHLLGTTFRAGIGYDALVLQLSAIPARLLIALVPAERKPLKGEVR